MIKKLQRKFVVIAMLSILLVMIVLVGSINLINFLNIDKECNNLLNLLVKYNGVFPAVDTIYKDEMRGLKISVETRFQTRYFTILTDDEGTVLETNLGQIAAVSEEEAIWYGQKVLHRSKSNGYEGNYKYRIAEEDGNKLIIFLDCSSQINMVVSYLMVCIVIAAACALVVFILVSVLSGRAIQPIIRNMEKQKQFITDAGHELKTPLAVILADTEVLELTEGKNEWTQSIRSQTNRLDGLVKNLLMLARTDEEQVEKVFSEFDVKETVSEMVKTFEPVAETKNRHIELRAESSIGMRGNEFEIRQLVSILMDNAIKYSSEGGKIEVVLYRQGKSIYLRVFNTGENIPIKNLENMFDRFYRGDTSRSRETGGYGIGLSIAKSIVREHKGKIGARSQDGKSIVIEAVFPVH